LSIRRSGPVQIPSGALELSGSATELPDVFIEQMKSNINEGLMKKFYNHLDSMPLDKREGWMMHFIEGSGLDVIISVMTQLDGILM
jgi:hypothetical protein